MNGELQECSPYASFREVASEVASFIYYRLPGTGETGFTGAFRNQMTASPIIPLRKLAQNRRCYTRRAAPSRHAMSGARYSNHLHAEEAAGSLEALIRDYESRGRRLRVRTTTSAPNVLPIHHPACLRPARLVNRRCCKRGTRCTASARRLAAPTPASPLPRLHRRSHACIAATAAATAATAATAAATPPSLVPRPPISALLSSPLAAP